MAAQPLQTHPEMEGNFNTLQVVVHNTTTETTDNASTAKPFIEAGTVEATLEDIRKYHIIPVFHRDNEPVISQVDFIQSTMEAVKETFPAERILSPSIRLSHPVKGRVPEAKNKPASELYEWEKTIYYERAAFIIEVASITDSIDGQPMSLTIGGVKAHHLDNLYSKRGTDQLFKIFIGFKVQVCTNLCVWSDGYAGDVKVKSVEQLQVAIKELLRSYDAVSSLKQMEDLQQYSLTEQQFATLIGRCRMYQHLPAGKRKDIPALEFHDTQINSVCRDYYKDNSFCREDNGNINLWRLYNLFTQANKSSYIDSFLDRSVNASELVASLANAVKHKQEHWFLS